MSELIFVTGASGFLGSHVVQQLLKGGYRVRAAARGQKAETLKATYADTPALEVVQISDIVHDQFPDALEGVDGVIHVASPLPGRAHVDAMLKSAIEGSLNVLRQGEKAGVKRFVVTGSTVSVVNNPTGTRRTSDVDWNIVTKEDALNTDDPFTHYAAAKKYAELAVWEWAEAHSHVEVTTVCPPFLYGPLPDRFPIPKPDFSALSTDVTIYQFIQPNGKFPLRPAYADFRDVAKAHVGALRSPPTKEVGRKRIIFASPYGFVFGNAVQLLKDKRPELKDRIIRGEPPVLDFDRYTVDYERIEKITGLKKSEVHTFEETLLDTVDSLLKLEAEWKSNGYKVDSVPSFQ